MKQSVSPKYEFNNYSPQKVSCSFSEFLKKVFNSDDLTLLQTKKSQKDDLIVLKNWQLEEKHPLTKRLQSDYFSS